MDPVLRNLHQRGASKFRQQAATDAECDWSKLNSSLYPVTFMAQANGRWKCCPHCIEPDHTGDECALSPRPRQDHLQRPLGLGLPAQGIGEGRGEPKSEFRVSGRPPRSRAARQGSARMVCYSFNDGECRFPGTCRYLHVCQRCSAEDHPACRYPVYPSGRREGVAAYPPGRREGATAYPPGRKEGAM